MTYNELRQHLIDMTKIEAARSFEFKKNDWDWFKPLPDNVKEKIREDFIAYTEKAAADLVDHHLSLMRSLSSYAYETIQLKT